MLSAGNGARDKGCVEGLKVGGLRTSCTSGAPTSQLLRQKNAETQRDNTR